MSAAVTDFDLDVVRMMRAQDLADSVSNSRFIMGSVHVEPRTEGGAFIVASTGMTMLVQIDSMAVVPRPINLTLRAQKVPGVWDDEEERFYSEQHWCGMRVTIPGSVLNNPTLADTRHNGNSHIASGSPGQQLVAETIEGEYPGWRKAFGTNGYTKEGQKHGKLPNERFGYSAGLLAELTCWSRQFRIHHPEDAGCAMITFGDDPLSIGVISANKMSKGAEHNLTTMLTAVGRPDLLKPDPR
jgi:hypothetical protein